MKTVKQSLKRALPQESFYKATDEAVKRLNAGIPEFNAKGSKIRFAANNEILEKINQAISSIEKVVEIYQEMLQDSKKLLLKQQKLIIIVDTEEDGWQGCQSES